MALLAFLQAWVETAKVERVAYSHHPSLEKSLASSKAHVNNRGSWLGPGLVDTSAFASWSSQAPFADIALVS